MREEICNAKLKNQEEGASVDMRDRKGGKGRGNGRNAPVQICYSVADEK